MPIEASELSSGEAPVPERPISTRKDTVKRTLQAASIIDSFALIDTDTSAAIVNLESDSVYSIYSFGSRNLNIEAIVVGAKPEKVEFDFDGAESTEKKSPYALCGDKNGIFNTCKNMQEGSHEVTAMAFQGGKVVSTLKISFTRTYKALICPSNPTISFLSRRQSNDRTTRVFGISQVLGILLLLYNSD